MGETAFRSFNYEQPLAIGGHVKRTYANMGGSASYATGGDNVNPQQFGAGPYGKFLNVVGGLTNSGTYDVKVIFPDEGPVSTAKLRIFVVATGAQVANAVDLSAERFRLVVDFIQ